MTHLLKLGECHVSRAPGHLNQSRTCINDPDTVTTGYCHLIRAELGVKRGKGGVCPFSVVMPWLIHHRVTALQ